MRLRARPCLYACAPVAGARVKARLLIPLSSLDDKGFNLLVRRPMEGAAPRRKPSYGGARPIEGALHNREDACYAEHDNRITR